jgi:hypothetical protein
MKSKFVAFIALIAFAFIAPQVSASACEQEQKAELTTDVQNVVFENVVEFKNVDFVFVETDNEIETKQIFYLPIQVQESNNLVIQEYFGRCLEQPLYTSNLGFSKTNKVYKRTHKNPESYFSWLLNIS